MERGISRRKLWVVGLACTATVAFICALGLLVGQGDGIGGGVFHALLLANPADVYRLFNLGGFDDVAALSGAIGMMSEVKLPAWALGGVQLAWVIVPLGIAGLLFGKKEI